MSLRLKRATALLGAICIAVSTLSVLTVVAETNVNTTVDAAQTGSKSVDYVTYLSEHVNTATPTLDKTVIKAQDFVSANPINAVSDSDTAGSIIPKNELEYLEYSVNAPTDGFYELGISYKPLTEKGKKGWDIAVNVNDELPFDEAENIRISATFRQDSKEIVTDAGGNEFAPSAVIITEYTEQYFIDPNGIIDGALRFFLKEGNNTVRLSFKNPEDLEIGSILVKSVSQIPSYQENSNSNKPDGKGEITVEAEDYLMLSDSVITVMADNSDPKMSPIDTKKLLLNSINGGTWSKQGQWIEWEITPEESGFYALNFRYMQDTLKGIGSRRCLKINGEIPFKEAESIVFPYSSGWEILTFSNSQGVPYGIYFEAGQTYKIRLEAVLDNLAPIIYQLNKILYDLNNLYREIIMITSTNADKYRDYHLDKEIPELMTRLDLYSKRLTACYERLSKISNGNTGDYAMLMTLSRQLESFIDEPDTIPKRVLNFQSNIGSVSSLLTELQRQPLSLDYFMFNQNEINIKQYKSGFLEKTWHSVKNFFLSFSMDYNGLESSNAKEEISLWFGGGRDQAQILWKMTNDMFTPQTGIGVNIKIVSASIVEAFLSGQSPDVAINVARDVPVNLAIRGGIRPVSDYPDFKEITSQFASEALTPYTFNDKVYALPDSQAFTMLFYRKDILDELGLKVPTTWQEFTDVANQLQLNKLQVAVPVEGDASIYYSQLLQSGGKLFNEDCSKVLLDSPLSQKAFTAWTDMYTKLGLPVSYDLFNRFRSGEIPLAVASYTMYGQLETAAPEIRGLWGMTLTPGTVKDNGSIDNTVVATGTAAVILNNTKKPDEAWEFIKWWTGKEAQARFATDVETAMGVIARVALANVKAAESQDWPYETALEIAKQRKFVTELPQVPGQYYLDRDLISAFRDVVYEDTNPLESLKKYNIRINGEIERKREEFGIEKK